MASRPRQLTPEGLEQLVRESLGLKLEADELERLLRRLQSLRVELDTLEQWLEPGTEPLPRVLIEDEDGR